ncbi:ABC transporter permease [Paenibacillus montanisoli]|uniref:Multidrug ABC transporter permease n=1 Tax=Paenibacillus montanisoli TaxID=2081970 RepID=A0A328U5Z5_9BACL|nr:ABC-2 family transporter protein [Paenibacillus montanisoli]RAP77980.1 multidrug ABC transporter permease [Paenibacillus montanisoli]
MIAATMGFWRKYMVVFKADWAIMMAYRSETLIWMFGAFVQPLVSLAVWTSLSGTGSIAGYRASDYVLYFCAVLLVDRLTRSWDVYELDSDIRQGTFSGKLLRPFHPIHWSINGNLVYKIFWAALMIPAWLLLALFIPAMRTPAGIGTIGLAVLAIALSSALRFLIGYMFGLLAFWSNRATAVYALYEGVHLFLAGRIAPLSMFPDWVAEAAKVLPFYVTVAFPVDLLTARLAGEPQQIAIGFAQQLGWLMILLLAFRLMWRQGLKRYGASGG